MREIHLDTRFGDSTKIERGEEVKQTIKMSETCKESITKGFGFDNSELVQIEDFINSQRGKTAKEILDNIIRNKKLNSKQKVIISYLIGNSAAHVSRDIPDVKIIQLDIHSDIPYFFGG